MTDIRTSKASPDIVNVKESIIVVGIDEYWAPEIRLQLKESNMMQTFTQFRGKSIEVQCRIANKCTRCNIHCNNWSHYSTEGGVTEVRLSNDTRRVLLELFDGNYSNTQIDINGRQIKTRTGKKKSGYGSDIGNFGQVTEWD